MTHSDRAAWRPFFEPGDDSQRRAVAAFNLADVLFLTGGAGSGKTHVAVALALRAVCDGSAREVWLCRPTVSCGDELGYEPGDLAAKLAPWMLPIGDVLRNQSFVAMSDLPLEPVSLQHMRGRTVQSTVAILDEAQNTTRAQMQMFLTRVGRGGKLIITGDAAQSDNREGALPWAIERLRGMARLAVVRLTGQYRRDMVSEINRRLSPNGAKKR